MTGRLQQELRASNRFYCRHEINQNQHHFSIVLGAFFTTLVSMSPDY